MPHPFFLTVRENREIFPLEFRNRFKVFFLENDEDYNNVSSWLDVVASSFPEFQDQGTYRFKITEEFYQRTSEYFKVLGFEHTENLPVYYFWALILIIDITLHNNGYSRDDNIFGFMTNTRFKDVHVVIIGNDPHKEKWSSGNAFHKSVCSSTKNLIQSVRKEMSLICDGEDQSILQLDDEFYTEEGNNCDLTGWISQNVLLINIGLTYNRVESKNDVWKEFIIGAWKYIINFFMKHLNDTRKNLVFMLLGKDVADNDNGTLVSVANHLKMKLYHPGNYDQLHQCWRWDTVLPFLNANLYLYQKGKVDHMIDWMSISLVSQKKTERMDKLRTLMDAVLAETSGTWRTLTIINKDGIRQLQKFTW